MALLLDNEMGGSQRASLQDFQPTLGYTMGTAAAATFADNPATRGYYWLKGLGAEQPSGYFADDTQRLDANQASDIAKEYGAATVPVAEGQFNEATARIQYERQRLHRIANDVDQNTPYDLWETPVRALTRAAVTLADPFNLASMFIPVVGAEWTAAKMAAATGALGRLGVRLESGAIQGAVGMGALEAANIPLAHLIGDDYTSTDSLVNVLTGAGLGAALHGALGAFGKAYERPPLSPELDLAAKRTAIVQVLQDQPVSLDHFNQMEADRALQIESARGVLQPAPEATGEAGRQRVGVEQNVQGDEAAGTRQAETPRQIALDLDQTRSALKDNAAHNILDGDGRPPRVEPPPRPSEPGAKASPELTAEIQRATEATQQAEAAQQALRERMTPKGETPPEPKPSTELAAADTQIARAEAEAKAYENIANCQRLA